MEYVVTVFDEKLWDAHGSAWCRSVKSHGYTGVVLDCGITDAAKEKAKQLNFRVYPVKDKRGNNLDVFLAFVPQIETGESWLYLCDPTTKIENLHSQDALVCLDQKGDIEVSCLTSLQDRVKYKTLLKNSSEVNYASDIIGGGLYGWTAFLGFYDFLLTTQLLDSSGDATEFALNVFSIYFPDLVQHGGKSLEDQSYVDDEQNQPDPHRTAE
jgi:hypothetical protein